jgi:hypothetical protein
MATSYNNQPHIFLGMDGVLSNFYKSACRIHGQPYEPNNQTQFDLAGSWGISVAEFWEPLKVPYFWDSLEPYPWAEELYKELKEIAPVTILTAPSRDPGCIPGKLSWLKRELGIEQWQVIPTGQKHLLARHSGCILIDGSPTKCEKFSDFGGTALYFPQPWDQARGLAWGSVVDSATKLVRR